MSEWVWRDASGDVGLQAAGDDELQLRVGDEVLARLDLGAARELAQSLSAWSGAGSVAVVREGAYYQVYYRHEYANAEGELLPCVALGRSANDDDVYEWDEADLAAARKRVEDVASALAELHRLHRVSDDADAGRAWISLFRMPDDERIWKGFADELPAVGDAELID